MATKSSCFSVRILRASLIGFVDQAANFVIDLLRGCFRNILRLRNRVAKEDFLLVLAVGHLAELIGEAPLRNHGAGKLGGLLDIAKTRRR